MATTSKKLSQVWVQITTKLSSGLELGILVHGMQMTKWKYKLMESPKSGITVVSTLLMCVVVQTLIALRSWSSFHPITLLQLLLKLEVLYRKLILRFSTGDLRILSFQ